MTAVTLSLESQRELISLEAMSGLESAAQAARRLPQYFDTIKSHLSKSIVAPTMSLFDRKDEQWFTAHLSHTSYLELRDVEVACPMGLTSSLVDYTKSLLSATDLATKVLSKNVDPFNAWLEGKLGEPSTLTSLTTASIPNFETLKLKPQIDGVAKHFTQHSREFATTQYKNLVRRSGDWVEVAKNVHAMEQMLSDGYQQAVIDGSTRLSQNLDKLIHRIETDPANYKLSAPMVRSLAERSYETARAIEYYALIRFRFRELQVAMKDIQEKLKASN